VWRNPSTLHQVGAVSVIHEVPVIVLARMNMAALRLDHDVLDYLRAVDRSGRPHTDWRLRSPE
jgi:hypothetical protein